MVTDRLGTVRANTQGESFAYYPFGEERTSTVDGRDKFATYFRDTVGLDYAEQRYYNSSLGRFWSVDPGGIRTAHPGNPTSWNRYGYVNGDPVNFGDRRGSDPDCGPDMEWDGEGCIDGGGDGTGVTSSVSFPAPCANGQVSNGAVGAPGDPTGCDTPLPATAAALGMAGDLTSGLTEPTTWVALGGASLVAGAGGLLLEGLASTGTAAVGTAAAGAISGAAAPTSVFWSGPGSEAAAESYALANNGVTLGMTTLGQAALNGETTWEAASGAFASAASGTVQVFSDAPLTYFPNSIWYNVELPTLANNPNVTNIVFNPVPIIPRVP